MLVLGVLFALLLAVGALVFMMFFAMLLTTLIYFIVPRLQHTFAAIPLTEIWRHYAQARPLDDEEPTKPEPILVVLCKRPLDPEYLVGLAGRRPVFTRRKKEAKRLEHGDLAIRAWVRALEEKYGTEHVFVCYAKKGDSR